jgi:GH25 family lysozyme M1 (1,4-beta-N-acetylmuramidase)
LGLKRKVADLSHHNGRPDFERVQKEVDAVILSVGYGSDYTSQDDREYQRSVSECERLGLPYGVYLFGYAENMAMVNSEIAHVKRQIKGRKPRYPVYYDIEIPQLRVSQIKRIRNGRTILRRPDIRVVFTRTIPCSSNME